MNRFLSGFSTRLPASLVYMLQADEYNLREYLAWFWRAPDLRRVANRKALQRTAKARLLLAAVWAIILLLAAVIAVCLYIGHATTNAGWYISAALLALAAPTILAYAIAAPLWLGQILLQRPRERAIIRRATADLQAHPGFRIGVVGSYGKTTFKDALLAVLSAGRRVAATPGNMNTPIGISRFIERLSGDEEVLIFEMGEYYPGDILKLCQFTRPQLGIITGINEAHLERFKTLKATTSTIFELAGYLKREPVYKNGDNEIIRRRAPRDPWLYSQTGVDGWQVSDAKVELTGTSFTARKGDVTIKARTRLLGAHQIGPLVACIDIAERLGLTNKQITDGLAATAPVEHRLQPRQQAGATIVDDTYNGNLDGALAGLDWLAAVPATRRIYVTPGLVEQGSRTAAVHKIIGRRLADMTDLVVLVRNSTTPYFEQGLKEGKFAGQLQIIDDPVRFYSNLDQFVAAGDVVLLQNDWPDSYS